MTTLYGGDAVRVNALSSYDLLSVFRDAMVCPELPEAKAEKKTTRPEFCRNCGAKLSPDIKFCSNCGTKV